MFTDEDVNFAHLKPGDRNVEIEVSGKLLKFDCQEIAIPARVLRDLVVGNHVGAQLGFRQMVHTNRRNVSHLEQLGSCDPAMASDNDNTLDTCLSAWSKMAAAPMFVSRMGVASAQILSLDATGFDQAFAPGVYRASRSLIVLDFKAARPDVSAELFIGKATGLPTWSSGRLSAGTDVRYSRKAGN